MSKQVLIVDDEAAVRGLIAECLERDGFACTQAGSAEDASSLLALHEFDLVIADIILPGMDGLDLTRMIRRDHRSDVIVVTGFDKDFSRERAFEFGASDFIVKPVRQQELTLRVRKVLDHRDKAKEQAETLDRLRKMTITDGLTGLFNKRHFDNQVESEIRRALRYNRALAMLMLDIDHFKACNDRHGHVVGDVALARLAKVLKGGVRRMDFVFRYGGEEFAALLPETSFGKAGIVAERIRAAVAETNFAPTTGSAIHLTVSVGVAAYAPSEDAVMFTARADRAMYVSKQKGRNCVTCLPAGHGTNGVSGASEQALG